ncbi:MAG: 4-demethylwyosine synthase TYW1 [Candidatus Methanofastidiosia archaeon]
MLKMDERIERQLLKKGYGIYNHSATQICSWTKKSLKDKGVCYKQTFYGVDCHRCLQFSPAAVFCENNCIYCWRPMEFMRIYEMKEEEVNSPKEIYERLLIERKKLLSGFFGHPQVNERKLKEALKPTHFAISLSGEPTLYPLLPDLIGYLRGLPHTKSIFLVTNAQEPSMLKLLSKSNALPTQLYISCNAPNRDLFKKIMRPIYEDAWERFLKSLEICGNLRCRKVIRMTMIKGMNMDEEYFKEYAELLAPSKPHFIEIKAYMYLGYSRRRLREENMPSHEKIFSYAEKFLKDLENFEIMDEREESRIILLSNQEKNICRFIRNPIPQV